MEEECIENMTDPEIAWSMRRNNFEKFKTLVRMHLSFELDLNTEEFDLPNHEVVYYEKGKMKKWNRLSRKIKNCASKTNTSPTIESPIVLDDHFIRHFQQLKKFILMEKNVIQEGIFRKTGSVTRQNELRDCVFNDKYFDLSTGYTVHDCATVLKSFLSDLNEPVLTDAHYPAHCQIAPLFQVEGQMPVVDKHKEAHILNSMQLLLLLLPNENRILFQDIIEMLHTVSTFKDKNKMSAENLATLFVPHLICPRNLPPEALHYVAQTMFPIIAYMISKGSVIFQIPAKLSTDIRAYYHERKRKKTMSPEQTLDDSISDMSTVNTVYTFVDREKTAAAHNANNTDTELAQLYAHIQSLPESSKKRRLIKQFNKQNGQGTPLQLLIMNRRSETSRSAKSISDSIKKHIFHKGIINKTPKKTGITINTQTPIFSTKNPKLRVLFQSPSLSSSTNHNSSATLANLSSSNLSTKLHPLQKSRSSSSLILRTSLTKTQDCVTPKTCTSSFKTAPDEIDSDCFSLPQSGSKVVNEEDIESGMNKKTVVWKDQEFNLSTPKHNNHIDMSMRYKSEPNLSQIFENNLDKSIIKRKVNGVSMGDLEVSFSLSDTRRVKYTSVVDVCKNEESLGEDVASNEEENNLQNLPDKFADTSRGNGHHLYLHRNYDLFTSTPSAFLGRRSMSPITKSTQRMPKAMQESIMTPRSRKPVMLANNVGASDQTPKNNQNMSLQENDEDALACKKPSENQNQAEKKSLSNDFREYLLSRSLLTTSPEDSSFSSQPDDFGSTQDLDNLDESQLSLSLLHCLDGFRPDETNESNKNIGELLSMSNSSRRKRLALERDSSKLVGGDNVKVDSFVMTKKFLMTDYNENPGETSF